MSEKGFHHALKILPEVCVGCTHCMTACPTEALRVRDGHAVLLENRCVDCGKCMKVCPVGAIIIEQDDFSEIYNYKARVALVPSILIGQFPRHYPGRQIYSGLLDQGFTHVYEAEHGAGMLKEEINKYVVERKDIRPVISSFCPATLRLIQVRFPNLAENIMPLKAPLDLASVSIKEELIGRGYKPDEIGIFYITPCAAKIAAIKSPVGGDKSPIDGVINLDLIFNKVYNDFKRMKRSSCIIPEKEQLHPSEMEWSLTGGEAKHINGRSLSIDGIKNVTEFLESVENGTATNFDFIEIRACDESCSGGILTTANRFLATERLRERVDKYERNKSEGKLNTFKSIEKHRDAVLKNIRIKQVEPRSMLKLDEDFEKALFKMQQIKKITEYLPGLDCGGCGAPSCRTLAEDTVQGKAHTSDCIFVQYSLNSELSEKSDVIKVWGKEKIKKLKN